MRETEPVFMTRGITTGREMLLINIITLVFVLGEYTFTIYTHTLTRRPTCTRGRARTHARTFTGEGKGSTGCVGFDAVSAKNLSGSSGIINYRPLPPPPTSP